MRRDELLHPILKNINIFRQSSAILQTSRIFPHMHIHIEYLVDGESTNTSGQLACNECT